jgi:hypothetical protein
MQVSRHHQMLVILGRRNAGGRFECTPRILEVGSEGGVRE